MVFVSLNGNLEVCNFQKMNFFVDLKAEEPRVCLIAPFVFIYKCASDVQV